MTDWLCNCCCETAFSQREYCYLLCLLYTHVADGITFILYHHHLVTHLSFLQHSEFLNQTIPNPPFTTFIWTCWFNFLHTAITSVTVSPWAQNLPFQKILILRVYRLSLYLSDLVALRPITRFLCSSVFMIMDMGHVLHSKLASSGQLWDTLIFLDRYYFISHKFWEFSRVMGEHCVPITASSMGPPESGIKIDN